MHKSPRTRPVTVALRALEDIRHEPAIVPDARGFCIEGATDILIGRQSGKCVSYHRNTVRNQVDLKPIAAWVPSQNGFFALPPHRQSRVFVRRATTRPVPLVISRLPRTCSGPSTSGMIANAPSRTGNISALPVGGSPVAWNATS